MVLSSCGVKHKDQLFDYLPVKFKSDDKKISLIDYDGNIVAEEEFASTSQILPINDVITEINIDGKVKYCVLDDKKIKKSFFKGFIKTSITEKVFSKGIVFARTESRI